jgi:hypothetical protein
MTTTSGPPAQSPVPAAPVKADAPSASVGLAVVNGLLPGAGFCAAGRWPRGLLQAAMVLGTAAFGWSLHGGVAWPSWNPQAADFNLINNLTFLVQLGGGLPALASLAANHFGYLPLGGIAKAPYYELGGYYLIVAGAVNYFATLNFYDRLVKREGRLREQELDASAGGQI